MSLLTWNNLFSVGVMEIDNQHKKLVAIANRLNDAMKDGVGKDVLATILADLMAYTESHFAFEERLMDQYDYPLSPQHKAEHRELVKTVGEFSRQLGQGEAELTSGVMNFLRDWLSRHIMNSDKMFGRDLNSKGVH